MSKTETFSLSKTVADYPALPYRQIKEDILGAHYSLSLVFVGSTRARTLNKKYRKKTYIPNVLSFPLDEARGEVYITPEIAKREAHKFDMTYREYVGYLFIHGLLHLKGHLHGDTMEKAEKYYLRKHNLA